MWPRGDGARALAGLAMVLALVAGAAAAGSAPRQEDPVLAHGLAQQLRPGPARNVILFVGDGMGASAIAAARNYELGTGDPLAMDGLPLTGSLSTYSVARSDPERPVYVTDSAASATAIATGVKTVNGVIGLDAYGRKHVSLLQLAQRSGYRTGDVTTDAVHGATPAAQAAHVPDRSCYGPADMAACPGEAVENGGSGSIVEQLVSARPDVLLGGGMQTFRQSVGGGRFAGKSVLQRARSEGFQVVTESSQLRESRQGSPVLGLFAPGAMPPRWSGPTASAPEGQAGAAAGGRCRDNPDRRQRQPSLAEMTGSALRLLHRNPESSDEGFFLQVESANIDKRAHEADPCGQIGATLALDRAVAAGKRFAREHPDTMVVVTADHGQAGQVVSRGAQVPGRSATVRTPAGEELTLSYGTAGPGESQQHTGAAVPVAASGPHAGSLVGRHDQTDLFGSIADAMHLR